MVFSKNTFDLVKIVASGINCLRRPQFFPAPDDLGALPTIAASVYDRRLRATYDACIDRGRFESSIMGSRSQPPCRRSDSHNTRALTPCDAANRIVVADSALADFSPCSGTAVIALGAAVVAMT